jgi:hypothetical protein
MHRIEQGNYLVIDILPIFFNKKLGLAWCFRVIGVAGRSCRLGIH